MKLFFYTLDTKRNPKSILLRATWAVLRWKQGKSKAKYSSRIKTKKVVGFTQRGPANFCKRQRIKTGLPLKTETDVHWVPPKPTGDLECFKLNYIYWKEWKAETKKSKKMKNDSLPSVSCH